MRSIYYNEGYANYILLLGDAEDVSFSNPYDKDTYEYDEWELGNSDASDDYQ